MRIFSRLTILFLCALAVVSASAQGSQQSPYSSYGYGMLSDNASSAQRAMGGVGYAMNNSRQINVMNPASYAAMDSLTFLWDFGVSLTNLNAKENGNTAKKTGGGLDYVTMQFPICSFIGASVGVIPFTSVGYSFGSEVVHGTDSHSGYGGISQLYAGVGVRPFKGFSVGANVAYQWGTTVNDIYAITELGNTTLFERVIQVRDYHLDFGVQYDIRMGRRHKLTLGVTFAPGKSMHGHSWGVYYDVDNTSVPDTVDYHSLKGVYSIPARWGVGLAYTYDNRWTTEFDFTYQDWKKAKYRGVEGFEGCDFDTRWKAAGGMSFQANPRGSWARRITYRIGGYYTHDYITLGGNNVREYGLSAGFGLPAPGSKTLVNIGFEYKHRSSSPQQLVTENYFNITLGINFNEMWFWKNKIQ